MLHLLSATVYFPLFIVPFQIITFSFLPQENILQKVVMTAFADRTVVTIAVSLSVRSLVYFEASILFLLDYQ